MRNVYRVLWQVLPLTLFILASSALAQNGVTQIDSLNLPHGTAPQNTKFSACWGWVSPDGREYAFIGTYTGTSIVDLNVSPIREIAFVPGNTASYCYREFKTYQHYAYIVSEGGRGVQIVDLSRLPDTTGLLVREFNFVSGTKNTLRSHTVTYANGHLFLNGSANWSPGGVIIFSLENDPTNPQYVGEYQYAPNTTGYVHDSYVRNDTLYAASIYSGGGLYVVDIQNKANPQLLQTVHYTGSGTHHVWAAMDSRYAMTTDEIGSTPSSLKIWDLQNLGPGPPYTPTATYRASPVDLIHNVHGRGHYAYISHYTAGARVVDVHNLTAPVEVGSYDTYAGTSGGYNGCWGVYPYFPSGRWLGSDMQTGLHVFTFDGLAPRTRSPLLSPLDGDSLDFESPEMFQWRSAAVQADDPHYYQVHLWGPGIDTLLKAQDTSLAVATLPGFLPGQSYQWHVWIKDEFTSVSSQDTFQFVYSGPVSGVTPGGERPIVFNLSQNYPNPFNPTTVIRYRLPTSSRVVLKVYNLIGKEVATLVDDTKPAGSHDVQFDVQSLSSGVYFYTLDAAGLRATRKMILMR